MLKLPRRAKALLKNLLVTAVYGLTGDALADSPTTLKDSLSADVKADYQIMWTQYTQKRYVLAEELGRSLLKRAPTNCTIHYLMGNIYYQLGDKKSALAQYQYCVQTGQDKPTALMAARALRAMQKPIARLSIAVKPVAIKSIAVKPPIIDRRSLNRAINLLQRAQDTLCMKKRELDTTIIHIEEFARSRIKEIPLNTLQRRSTPITSNFSHNASASTDQLDSFANYDRPAEVARIRATETAKIKRLIEDFEKLQAQVISTALKQAHEIFADELQAAPADLLSKSAAPEPSPVQPSFLQSLTACGITASAASAFNSADKANFAGRTITDAEKVKPFRVVQTATGSAAHRAGLIAGDLIVQSRYTAAADIWNLKFARADKFYSIVLKPQKAINECEHQAATAVKLREKKGVEPAQIASEKAWKQIRDSDIVFMVDMSYSMRAPVGETGQGRWEWAANRVADFAEKVTAQNTKPLMIIECARNSYRQRDQNAQSLQQFLLTSSPRGPSNIATPMTAILNDYLDDRTAKPLLLIVLTAGHPELGESLESVISNASERVKSANSIRVVFVQIGEDPEGTAMLQMLDQDLPYSGAKHDIVDFINFSELQSSGLSKALLDAYEKPRTAGITTAPPMLSTLAEKIAELSRLEPDE